MEHQRHFGGKDAGDDMIEQQVIEHRRIIQCPVAKRDRPGGEAGAEDGRIAESHVAGIAATVGGVIEVWFPFPRRMA